MKIKKAEHKSFLYNLFFVNTPNGSQLRQIPIDKLMVASSAAKKLRDKSVKDEKADTIRFVKGEVEFSPEEWVLLKDFLNTKTMGTIMEAEVMEELKEIYLSNQAVEFKACLKGNKVDEIYIIDELYIPETFSQQFNRVVAEPCSSDSLVSLHSHPYKRCVPSQQDIRNFNLFKERSPEALMIVMCEPNKFSIHK